MLINLLAAGLAGVAIPLVLDRLGLDPAVSSSVFLTTVTDCRRLLRLPGPRHASSCCSRVLGPEEEGTVRASLTLAAGLLALTTVPAAAFESRQGCSVADQACQATPKVSGGAGVALEPGQSYRLLGANKADATHFQIRLPSASPSDRWVAVSCGHTLNSCEASPGGPTPPTKSASREYVLSLSWQPAFCQTHQTKPECKSEPPDGFEASNLTLHGLWPQDGEYCGVSAARPARRRGRTLDRTARRAAHAREPEGARGGDARNAVALERHEWTRHGTCSGASPDVYFANAVRLVREVDGSPVRDLFAEHVGQEMTVDQIRSAFDSAFGEGTGQHAESSATARERAPHHRGAGLPRRGGLRHDAFQAVARQRPEGARELPVGKGGPGRVRSLNGTGQGLPRPGITPSGHQSPSTWSNV